MTTYITKKWDDGSYVESVEVSYIVEGSKCKLALQRRVRKDGNVNLLSFLLHDNIICSDKENLSLHIHKPSTHFLFPLDSNIPWTKTKNIHPRDGVADTKVYLYGSANRCGLLVWECKKTDNCLRHSCMTVTMAHYFVSSNGSAVVNRTSETTEIGFSVVVKVGVCDGKFDITVDGPEQHSVSALLYMFDQVNRSGIWKPSMCPHCANIQRECSSTPPNAVTIDNGGEFAGHGCGAFVGGNFYVYN